jgi:hypothetical protein
MFSKGTIIENYFRAQLLNHIAPSEDHILRVLEYSVPRTVTNVREGKK